MFWVVLLEMASKQKRGRGRPRKLPKKDIQFEEEDEAMVIKPLPKKKEFDEIIIRLNNANLRPAEIADILRRKYGLSTEMMNRKTIESRLRYLKKNRLGSLAPVNAKGTKNLFATDIPATCSYSFLFSFSPVSIS